MRSRIRMGIPALAVVVAGVLALPAVRAAGSSGCEPMTWTDGHLAMRK